LSVLFQGLQKSVLAHTVQLKESNEENYSMWRGVVTALCENG